MPYLSRPLGEALFASSEPRPRRVCRNGTLTQSLLLLSGVCILVSLPSLATWTVSERERLEHAISLPAQPARATLQMPRRGHFLRPARASVGPAPATPGSSSGIIARPVATKALATMTDDEKIAEWEKTQTIDESAMLANADFPIQPEDLIRRAKLFIAEEGGLANPDLLSDDFQFVAPVVGPLSKERYMSALGGFHFQEAFPDFSMQFHHFRVDPFEPNRVWYTQRGRGTNTAESPQSPLFKTPTGKNFVSPPEACSLRFDPDGKVNQLTLGYVMDRQLGNTGGLGGMFGIAYAVGKPLPFREALPWKPSLPYRLFNKIGEFVQGLQGGQKA